MTQTHIFWQFHQDILSALQQLEHQKILPAQLDTSKVTAEPPRDPQHGDLATNAVMVLVKFAQMTPAVLADHLIKTMQSHPDVKDIQFAPPGFINFTFTDDFWRRTLMSILQADTTYGQLTLGQRIHVNVEYLSTNPTGPIHIGHCRGAVVGDVLAHVLKKAGYYVTKEFYINDAGGQVNHLARSVYQRYLESLNLTPTDKPFYGGSYLVPVGQALATRDGNKWVNQPEEQWLPLFRQFAVDQMMARIKADLAQLSIHYDIYTSEKALVDGHKVDEAYQLLSKKGLIYRGVLPPPRGKIPDDYESREQDLFKSTDFGDDLDRPLRKADGSWTYIMPDIAYHLDKYQRGAQHMVLVLGADHGGYVSRLTAAVKALSDHQASLSVKLCQMVKFIDKGSVLKMSKRAGVFVTLNDAIAQVGCDVLRFMMIWRKNDAPLDFDFDKVIEATRDNPVFYIQYAFARCHSVKRHAISVFPQLATEASTDAVDLNLLTMPEEINLIKQLANWPRIIELAARTEEPHRIAYYLYEIATLFHALWNQGKDDTQLRFIMVNDLALTRAKLALIEAVVIVLKSGLDTLGVTAKKEMRDDNN